MEGNQNNMNQPQAPAQAPAPAPAYTSPAPMSMPSNAPQSGSTVAIIVSVVVLLAVGILGGLYYYGQKSVMDDKMPAAAVEDQTTASIKAQGTGSDTTSLENDLNSTNVDSLDAEINAS